MNFDELVSYIAYMIVLAWDNLLYYAGHLVVKVVNNL